MKAIFWIKIKVREAKYGPQPRAFEVAGVPQCTVNKPSTGKDEFAFKINFTVPDGYFRTPELSISIEMPELDAHCKLDADVQQNLSEIIQQQLGVKAHVSISGEAAPQADKGE